MFILFLVRLYCIEFVISMANKKIIDMIKKAFPVHRLLRSSALARKKSLTRDTTTCAAMNAQRQDGDNARFCMSTERQSD